MSNTSSSGAMPRTSIPIRASRSIPPVTYTVTCLYQFGNTRYKSPASVTDISVDSLYSENVPHAHCAIVSLAGPIYRSGNKAPNKSAQNVAFAVHFANSGILENSPGYWRLSPLSVSIGGGGGPETSAVED